MRKIAATREEIDQIIARLEAMSDVKEVTIVPALHVRVVLHDQANRDVVYEVEGDLVDENPHLAFEFQTLFSRKA